MARRRQMQIEIDKLRADLDATKQRARRRPPPPMPLGDALVQLSREVSALRAVLVCASRGVPREQLWADLGYTPEQIKGFLEGGTIP